MAHTKEINKEATLQKILDWGNRSIGHSINTEKLNNAMEKNNWETSLKEMANFCDVEIIYK